MRKDKESSPPCFDDSYSLISTVNKGEGKCKIYLVKSLLDNQYYAIKSLKSLYGLSELNIMDLEREFCYLNTLNHPNIVKVFDIKRKGKVIGSTGLLKRKTYMVLEYAAKGDLFNIVKAKKSLPEHIALFFFKQLISVLDYLDFKGIAHRDIKLENILIDEDGRLMVADFEFACIFRNLNGLVELSSKLGTYNYMAPEVAVLRKGGMYHGDKIDLFAVGVILFIMLGGSVPFHHAISSDKFYCYFIQEKEHLFWERHGNKKFSGEAKEIIGQMLRFDRSKRISLEEIKESRFYNMDVASADEVIDFINI